MNTMINMDPWSFLDDMLSVGGNAFRAMRARATGRFPPVNVYLDDDAMIVDIQLPGKNAKNVDLSLEAQAITIADKPVAEEGKPVPAPAWSRRIELPFHVDAAKTSAKFENGILRIELPKAETEGIRKIAIA